MLEGVEVTFETAFMDFPLSTDTAVDVSTEGDQFRTTDYNEPEMKSACNKDAYSPIKGKKGKLNEFIPKLPLNHF